MAIFSKLFHSLAERKRDIQKIQADVERASPEGCTKEQLEESVVSAGEALVLKTLEMYYNTVKKAHNTYALSNEQLLSTDLEYNKDMPRRVRKQVAILGENLRNNIYSVARVIEQYNFQAVEEAIQQFHFSPFEQQRVHDLLGAQKEVHISYQSIRLAIQLFKQINKNLLEQIETSKLETDRYQETDLLLKNAILVYELAHAIVTLLHHFELEGIETLKNLHAQMMEEIEMNRRADEELKRRCQKDELAPTVKEQTLKMVENRDQLRQIVRSEWDRFINKLKIVEENVRTVKKQIPNLEMIRDNAKNQLGFLQIVAITQMIKDNLEAVKGLLAIEDIPLAPITPTDLCRLLGINLGDAFTPPQRIAAMTSTAEQLPQSQIASRFSNKMTRICPHCGKTYQINATFIGKTATCKRCRHKFTL